jgi:putative sterol carrier protein
VVRFLSDDWLAEAARLTQAGPGNGPGGACVVEQVVRAPDREVRYQIVLADGAARVTSAAGAEADVEIAEDYAVAAAISRGELDPTQALEAGHIKVRGDAGRLAGFADALARLPDVLAPLRDRTEY